LHRFFLPSLEWAIANGPIHPRSGNLSLPAGVGEADFESWVKSHEPVMMLAQVCGFVVERAWGRAAGSGEPVLLVSPDGVSDASASHPGVATGSEPSLVLEISRGLAGGDWPSNAPWVGDQGGSRSISLLDGAPSGSQWLRWDGFACNRGIPVPSGDLAAAMLEADPAPTYLPFFDPGSWSDGEGFTAIAFGSLDYPELFWGDGDLSASTVNGQVSCSSLGMGLETNLKRAMDHSGLSRNEPPAWRAYYDSWGEGGREREDLVSLTYARVLMDLANEGLIVWDPGHSAADDGDRNLLEEAEGILASGIGSEEDVETLVAYAEPSNPDREAGVDDAVAELLFAALEDRLADDGTVAQPAIVRAVSLLVSRAGDAVYGEDRSGVMEWAGRLVGLFFADGLGGDVVADPAVGGLADLLGEDAPSGYDASAAAIFLQTLLAVSPRDRLDSIERSAGLRALVEHYDDVPPAWFLDDAEVPVGWSMATYRLLCWLTMLEGERLADEGDTPGNCTAQAAHFLRRILGHLPLVQVRGSDLVAAALAGGSPTWDVHEPPPWGVDAGCLAAHLHHGIAKAWREVLDEGFDQLDDEHNVRDLARIQHGVARILLDDEYRDLVGQLDLEAYEIELTNLGDYASREWESARAAVVKKAYRHVLANIETGPAVLDEEPMGGESMKAVLEQIAPISQEVLGSEAAIWYGALVAGALESEEDELDCDFTQEVATLAGLEAVLGGFGDSAADTDFVQAYRASVFAIHGLIWFQDTLDLADADPTTLDTLLDLVAHHAGETPDWTDDPEMPGAIWALRRVRASVKVAHGFVNSSTFLDPVARAPLYAPDSVYYRELVNAFENGGLSGSDATKKADQLVKAGSYTAALAGLLGAATGFWALGEDIGELEVDASEYEKSWLAFNAVKHLGQGVQGSLEVLACTSVWLNAPKPAVGFLTAAKAVARPVHILVAITYGAKAVELFQTDHAVGGMAALTVMGGSIVLATCPLGPVATAIVGVVVLVGMIAVAIVQALRDELWDYVKLTLQARNVLVEEVALVLNLTGEMAVEDSTLVYSRHCTSGTSTGLPDDWEGAGLPQGRWWIRDGDDAIRAVSIEEDAGQIRWPVSGYFRSAVPHQDADLYDEPARAERLLALESVGPGRVLGTVSSLVRLWNHDVRVPDSIGGGQTQLLVLDGTPVEFGDPLAEIAPADGGAPVPLYAPLPGTVRSDHPSVVTEIHVDPGQILLRIERPEDS